MKPFCTRDNGVTHHEAEVAAIQLVMGVVQYTQIEALTEPHDVRP